jgi:anti-sigma regulatory factor (Ser/Thr protein kinase)
VKLRFEVGGEDFSLAGKASTELKRALGRLGVAPEHVRRAAVAMYEAEINMVIHAGGGIAEAEIGADCVCMTLTDAGPGIPDLDLAMTEGWSTASEHYRELGFGAGMGLPNIKRNVDEMSIDTEVGRGTRVSMTVRFTAGQKTGGGAA